MQKSERFEMRLDSETAQVIDAWRDANCPGSSRAHVVRLLIGRGLSTPIGEPHRFSDGEKLLMSLLRDLLHHQNAPTDSIDVALAGFRSGNHWAIDLAFGGLFQPAVSSPENARFVLDTLAMWDVFERAFAGFTEEERAVVLADTQEEAVLRKICDSPPPPRDITFVGFHPEREAELVQIARFIVEMTPLFPRLRGRDLAAAQGDTVVKHRERLQKFNALRPTLVGRLPSPEEVRAFATEWVPIRTQEDMALATTILAYRNFSPPDCPNWYVPTI